MKAAITILLAFSALVLGQRQPKYNIKVPMTVEVLDSYLPDNTCDIDLDWTTEAVTFAFYNLYQAYSGVTNSKDVIFGAAQAWCFEHMYLKPLESGYGRRFKITNATYSGSATATGGATLDDIATTVYMYYYPEKNTVKDGRTSVLTDFSDECALGNDTEISSYHLTAQPDYKENWSPCTGSGWTASPGDRVMFGMQHNVFMESPRDVPDGSPFSVSIGKPGKGQSDITVRLTLEWEACDPAAEPIAAWGHPYH